MFYKVNITHGIAKLKVSLNTILIIDTQQTCIKSHNRNY